MTMILAGSKSPDPFCPNPTKHSSFVVIQRMGKLGEIVNETHSESHGSPKYLKLFYIFQSQTSVRFFLNSEPSNSLAEPYYIQEFYTLPEFCTMCVFVCVCVFILYPHSLKCIYMSFRCIAKFAKHSAFSIM